MYMYILIFFFSRIILWGLYAFISLGKLHFTVWDLCSCTDKPIQLQISFTYPAQYCTVKHHHSSIHDDQSPTPFLRNFIIKFPPAEATGGNQLLTVIFHRFHHFIDNPEIPRVSLLKRYITQNSHIRTQLWGDISNSINSLDSRGLCSEFECI